MGRGTGVAPACGPTSRGISSSFASAHFSIKNYVAGIFCQECFLMTPGSSLANAINHSIYTVPQLSFQIHSQRQLLQWGAGTDPTDFGELLIKFLDLCEPDDSMLIVWREKKNQSWEEYVLHRHLGKSDHDLLFFGPWKAKHIQYHH